MVLPADSPLFGVLFDSNYFNGAATGVDEGDHVESGSGNGETTKGGSSMR